MALQETCPFFAQAPEELVTDVGFVENLSFLSVPVLRAVGATA